MNPNDEQRKALEEFYANLSPEERRERVFLQPAFRDLYNEITEAHRSVQVPRYFWTKWVPVLGPVATTLYMQLRQYCYFNPKTGETRNICFPKQDTLAKEIGVNDRKTIRKALLLLEEHGFIKREHTYYHDKETKRTLKGSDRYFVYFEIPLVTEDAIDLLIREAARAASTEAERKGKKSPYTPDGVDNSFRKGNLSPYLVGEKIPHRTSTRTSTSNVPNVGGSDLQKSLRTDPRVQTLTEPERASRETLASYIGDQLMTMAGHWSAGDHKSSGFHRRVAFLMPEHLVQEALTATRDAIEDERAGRKTLHRGPAAYFAGAVRRIAERERLDLGIEWNEKQGP